MLPFLKNKNKSGNVGIIMKTRMPDEKPQEDHEDKEAGMHACAEDLINAVHARDVNGVVEALRAAFEIADSEPHEEGSHIEPHSYDAQKED